MTWKKNSLSNILIYLPNNVGRKEIEIKKTSCKDKKRRTLFDKFSQSFIHKFHKRVQCVIVKNQDLLKINNLVVY